MGEISVGEWFDFLFYCIIVVLAVIFLLRRMRAAVREVDEVLEHSCNDPMCFAPELRHALKPVKAPAAPNASPPPVSYSSQYDLPCIVITKDDYIASAQYLIDLCVFYGAVHEQMVGPDETEVDYVLHISTPERDVGPELYSEIAIRRMYP